MQKGDDLLEKNKDRNTPSKNGAKTNGSKTKPKGGEAFDDVYQFVRSNTRDTIAYVILVIGLILLFVRPFWGELFIGVVGGFYFANELTRVIKNMQGFVEDEGLIRSLILAGIALAILIAAPGFIIGAAAALGIKQLISKA